MLRQCKFGVDNQQQTEGGCGVIIEQCKSKRRKMKESSGNMDQLYMYSKIPTKGGKHG